MLKYLLVPRKHFNTTSLPCYRGSVTFACFLSSLFLGSLFLMLMHASWDLVGRPICKQMSVVPPSGLHTISHSDQDRGWRWNVGRTIIRWGDSFASSGQSQAPSSLHTFLDVLHANKMLVPHIRLSFSQFSTHLHHPLSLAYGSEDERMGDDISRKLLHHLTIPTSLHPPDEVLFIRSGFTHSEVVGASHSSCLMSHT